ncbi:hypothetical protein QFZ77_007647 [Paenibacillus sp. V4I3]|uniref:hypothetical protein n=1 Tax=Paenibacillus sp. V4I3 TaxID=3042305 RepID=UPI002781C654|nr:hypothetical protein [Paenibacillus sp. V4I3]MDQ0878988.1 hypothetical protein [Paenibacillus sp. V4I3]
MLLPDIFNESNNDEMERYWFVLGFVYVNLIEDESIKSFLHDCNKQSPRKTTEMCMHLWKKTTNEEVDFIAKSPEVSNDLTLRIKLFQYHSTHLQELQTELMSLLNIIESTQKKAIQYEKIKMESDLSDLREWVSTNNGIPRVSEVMEVLNEKFNNLHLIFEQRLYDQGKLALSGPSFEANVKVESFENFMYLELFIYINNFVLPLRCDAPACGKIIPNPSKHQRRNKLLLDYPTYCPGEDHYDSCRARGKRYRDKIRKRNSRKEVKI